MRSASRAERGSVTAEFVVALPAVLVVLALALGGVRVAGMQVRLSDAVADAARSLARGDGGDRVAQQLGRRVPGATLESEVVDGLVCATATLDPGGPAGLAGITVQARSCSLGRE